MPYQYPRGSTIHMIRSWQTYVHSFLIWPRWMMYRVSWTVGYSRLRSRVCLWPDAPRIIVSPAIHLSHSLVHMRSMSNLLSYTPASNLRNQSLLSPRLISVFTSISTNSALSPTQPYSHSIPSPSSFSSVLLEYTHTPTLPSFHYFISDTRTHSARGSVAE